MSELTKRVMTAVVLAVGAYFWMFEADKNLFDMITFIVGLLAIIELFLLVKLPSALLYIVTLAIPSLFWLWAPETIPALFPLIVLMVFWTMIYVVVMRKNSTPEIFTRLVYAQWMSLLVLLFCYTLVTVHQIEHGVLFLTGALAGVWAADISAYFAGKGWGKTKLCPAISPGKSVEGFLAGVILGTLVSALVWTTWISMEPSKALILGMILILTSVAGDLGESALKRAVGAKDSGKMLPGHGGILDRIDALLPSLPLVSMLWFVLA